MTTSGGINRFTMLSLWELVAEVGSAALILLPVFTVLTNSATLRNYLLGGTIVGVLLAVTLSAVGFGDRWVRKRQVAGWSVVLFAIGMIVFGGLLTLLNPENGLPLSAQLIGDALRAMTPGINLLLSSCLAVTSFALSSLARFLVAKLQH